MRRALREPVAGPPLAELIGPRDHVAVVFPDLTRPMPNRTVLPPLLDELARLGAGPDRVELLCATGTHRAATPAEMEELVGPELVGAVPGARPPQRRRRPRDGRTGRRGARPARAALRGRHRPGVHGVRGAALLRRVERRPQGGVPGSGRRGDHPGRPQPGPDRRSRRLLRAPGGQPGPPVPPGCRSPRPAAALGRRGHRRGPPADRGVRRTAGRCPRGGPAVRGRILAGGGGRALRRGGDDQRRAPPRPQPLPGGEGNGGGGAGGATGRHHRARRRLRRRDSRGQRLRPPAGRAGCAGQPGVGRGDPGARPLAGPGPGPGARPGRGLAAHRRPERRGGGGGPPAPGAGPAGGARRGPGTGRPGAAAARSSPRARSPWRSPGGSPPPPDRARIGPPETDGGVRDSVAAMAEGALFDFTVPDELLQEAVSRAPRPDGGGRPGHDARHRGGQAPAADRDPRGPAATRRSCS